MKRKQDEAMPENLRKVAVQLGVKKPKRGDVVFVDAHKRPIKQQVAKVQGYSRKFNPRGPDKEKPNRARIGPKSLISMIG